MKMIMLCQLRWTMEKTNKPDVVSTARFNEISEQVKRSIELATQLSNFFKFSEPTPINPSLSNIPVSLPCSNFEFHEPLQRVNHEEKDAAEDLVKLLSLLNLNHSDQSCIQLDCSIQKGDNTGYASIETDGDQPTDIDPKPLNKDNERNFMLEKELDHQAFPLDFSTPSSNIENDDLQTQVVRLIESLDSNTSDLEIDDGQSSSPQKYLNHQPCPFQTDCGSQRDRDNSIYIDPKPTHLCKDNDRNLSMSEEELDHRTFPFQLDSSTGASNVEDHNIPTDVNESTEPDLNKSPLEMNNNGQSSSPQKFLEPCPFQVDSPMRPLTVEKDDIQVEVVRSTDLDPNTQITNLDIDDNEQMPPPRKQLDNQPLPLLIKHIQSITWPDHDKIPYVPAMELFGQTFDRVMVYGVVTSLNVENKGLSQRFVIDDGTGSVNVVWKANDRMIGKFETLKILLQMNSNCVNNYRAHTKFAQTGRRSEIMSAVRSICDE